MIMGGRVHEWLDFMIKCTYRNKVLKSAKDFPIFQCLGLQTQITVFHDANHRQQDSRSPNKRGNNEVVGGKSERFGTPRRCKDV